MPVEAQVEQDTMVGALILMDATIGTVSAKPRTERRGKGLRRAIEGVIPLNTGYVNKGIGGSAKIQVRNYR